MSESSGERLRELALQIEQSGQVELGQEVRREAERLLERVLQAEESSRRVIDQMAHAGRLVELGTMSAAIFHEMNQPLLGIKGFAELIAESIERGSDTGQLDKLRFWAREIFKQVERIMHLQEQVTTFLHPAEPDDEPLRLGTAVEEAIELFKFRFTKKRVQLGVSVPDDLPTIAMSHQHLVQVIINLVGNALDALIEQPERVLRIVATAGSGGRVRLVVADTGRGISVPDRERVFEPFFTTKGQKGSGLGLFISRRLLEHAGGAIQLIDPESLGWQQTPKTVFEVSLPTVRDSFGGAIEPESEPTPAPDEDLLKSLEAHMRRFTEELSITRRVLVVDDEVVIRRILSEYLKGQAVLVDVAGSAEEALRALAAREYAVVITDKNLPGQDGLVLLREIRETWSRIEVLVITGYASVESALTALQDGAFDYIPKPFPSLSYVGAKTRAALDRFEFEQRIHTAIAFLVNANKALLAEMGGDERRASVQHLKKILASYESEDGDERLLVQGPASLKAAIRQIGYQVIESQTVEEALEKISAERLPVLVYAEEAGSSEGAEVVRRLQDVDPTAAVFVIGREAKLKKIIEAIGVGVGDYLVRPVEGKEIFATRLQRLVARQKKVARYRNLIEALKRLNIDLQDNRSQT